MCAEARRKMSAQRPAGSMRFRCMLLVTRFNGDEFSSDVGDGRFGSLAEIDACDNEVRFTLELGHRAMLSSQHLFGCAK